MPNLFHVAYNRGSICYEVIQKHAARNYSMSTIYPWITSVSYTGEVADETASGSFLAFCTDVEFRQILACLEAVRERGSEAQDVILRLDGTLAVQRRRDRVSGTSSE